MSRFSLPEKEQKSMDGLSTIDRISDLPMNVIDTILGKLPIEDAVKTSILSRNWRDKWTSLSQLVFHSKLVCTRLEGTIYRVLLRHTSAIDKFELFTAFCPKFYDLDQWMLILRDRAIKDIDLHLNVLIGQPRYKLHSCLFSCQLTSLALNGCTFQPPPTFKGFKNLKFLRLDHVTIHNDVLNSLMHSDQLERVHLSCLDGINLLKIRSPNLQYLELIDAFDDICLANSPALCMVIIFWSLLIYHPRLKRARTHNLVSFLGSLPAIKIISLWGPFFEFLATSGTIPHTLPLTINRLESLRLDYFNFNVDEISAVLFILRSSPNLKILVIVDFNERNDIERVNKFLKEQYLRDCCFSQLQQVQMRICINRRPATGLIKFILACSPLLESMQIGYPGDDKGSLKKKCCHSKELRCKRVLKSSEQRRKESYLSLKNCFQ